MVFSIIFQILSNVVETEKTKKYNAELRRKLLPY